MPDLTPLHPRTPAKETNKVKGGEARGEERGGRLSPIPHPPHPPPHPRGQRFAVEENKSLRLERDQLKSYIPSSPGISDHSPAVVYLLPNPKKVSKPFKFFDFLADHSQFLPIVQKVWRKIIIGNPMYGVCEKLKLLQYEFKQLNTQSFTDVSSRVLDTKHKLEVLQKELGSNPTNPSTLSQERDLYRLYLSLVRAEESLAKQKSRIQWLKLGDQCTSYFFKSVSNLRNKSRITSLVLDDGSTSQDIDKIKSTFVSFYTCWGQPTPPLI